MFAFLICAAASSWWDAIDNIVTCVTQLPEKAMKMISDLKKFREEVQEKYNELQEQIEDMKASVEARVDSVKEQIESVTDTVTDAKNDALSFYEKYKLYIYITAGCVVVLAVGVKLGGILAERKRKAMERELLEFNYNRMNEVRGGSDQRAPEYSSEDTAGAYYRGDQKGRRSLAAEEV